MKNLLSKYRIQIKIIAIVICALLAVNRGIMFTERGNDMDRVIAIYWIIMAVYYTLNLIMALRAKKFVQESALNNSSKASSE